MTEPPGVEQTVPVVQRYLPAVVAFCLLLGLCVLGGRYGFIGAHALPFAWVPGPWQLPDIPAGRFMMLYAATGGCSLLLLLTWPRKLSARRNGWLLVGVAVLCRLALLTHEPSDDLYRYLWEGRLVREGINPYQYAPENPMFADVLADDPYRPLVNHPDLTAAYPPLALVYFSAISWISYTPMAMKAGMVVFDVAAVLLLLGILARRGLSRRWVLVYAVNPIVLYAFAGQGHVDAMMIAFTAGALWCYDAGRWRGLFICLGLAVQCKYVPVILVPFFFTRQNWRYGWWLLVAGGLPAVPFVIGGSGALFSSLGVFLGQKAFNGSVHGLMRVIFGSIGPATTVSTILLIVLLGWGYVRLHPETRRRFKNDPVPALFFAMGALLVLAPTVHFWYVSWILPLLVLRPTASWLLLCVTMAAYFAANGVAHHTGEWRLPAGYQVFVWLPFWVCLLREISMGVMRMRRKTSGAWAPPRTVSVIVPVLREVFYIDACIRSVTQNESLKEVIVVDAGSMDGTVDRASAQGAVVIHHNAKPDAGGGRGGQIMAGLARATGDVVAIVHADTTLEPGALDRILKVMDKQPEVAGGAVGCIFKDGGWGLRFLETANDFRAAFLGIAFGDQVQFFRRRLVADHQAFKAIPLMEDVELSLGLKRLGPTIYLFGSVGVSARSWRAGGGRRAWLIVKLLAQYLTQRLWKTPDAVAMYRRYYGR